MKMTKEGIMALTRTGIMCVTATAIVKGRPSIDAGGGTGGGVAGRALFCGLIRAEGEHPCQPRASSNLSPKVLGNIDGTRDKRPIVVEGADVNTDLFTEVQCASLVRPLASTEHLVDC